jgi:homopolymeric O-antigen transport system ATP-binding protein
MSDIAIRIENLSKRYRIGGPRAPYKTLRESLVGAVTNPIRRLHAGESAAPKTQTIWALKDVFLEVKTGEAIGIIGRNGAGKSTLLKILSRITKPTQGRVEVYGRVGSLLEVGMGFHPERTGRENIFLNGAILGMKKAEIEAKFDEIVSFAEIEKFVDTPVKHYSSGMYVRLAFAVAAHLEPEILLVDEVLAVGDSGFQKKCLGKMDDVAREGRTVLFVSHNLGAIASLCNRAVWLDSGHTVADGDSRRTIQEYSSEIVARSTSLPLLDRLDRRGDGRIRFVGLHWETYEGERVSVLRSGGNYKLVLAYECPDCSSKNDVLVSFVIKDPSGFFLLLHQTNFSNQTFDQIPPKGLFVCRLPRLPLGAGEYLLNIFVGINEWPCDELNDAAKVTVEYGDFFGTGHPGRPTLCKVLVNCDWELRAEVADNEPIH